MNKYINKLIQLTTIVKVEDNTSNTIIFGDDRLVSKFKRDQDQVDLESLKRNWDNKWKALGNLWDKQREMYRNLYSFFNMFYYSFEQLKFNKALSIENIFEDKLKGLYHNELAGVCLYSMYQHGKKCIEFSENLGLVDASHSEHDFTEKFKETRNKLIEHNHNPNGLQLYISPSVWSLSSTNSFMEIDIHTSQERAFSAYIDYYEDYYNLESILANIIKQFKSK